MRFRLVIVATAAIAMPAPAQLLLDRADPSVIQRDIEADGRRAAPEEGTPVLNRPETDQAATASITPGAIIVESAVLPAEIFAPILEPYLGRPIDGAGLKELLSRIAAVARAKGYLFATASIAPQTLSAGVLRVTLDEGRVDAVRTLGAPNAQVERLLGRLVGAGPVQAAAFERTLLLAGDVAGVRIVETRYVRENGFGILLVTLAGDRSGVAVQIDNRGTGIVGPFRSTAVASLRGLAGSGDELSVLVANTPFDPSEFLFGQVRYAAPLDDNGNQIWSSAALGRTRPGGNLNRFDVRGDSFSLSTGVSLPLIRSRQTSLWGTVELRGLWLDQDILSVRVRRDRIVTLTAGLEGAARLAGGTLRGSGAAVIGLPIAGVTRASDPLGSRPDGDARFGRIEAYAQWTRPLAAKVSLKLAGAAQLATRTLLASEEIGLGGAQFGRAYDYSERSGENGVAGSAELRFDLKAPPSGLVRSVQLYAFADAGYVDNAGRGLGGGDLYSAGGGARIGLAKSLDAEVEAAVPIGADRFTTGDRDPRLSVRLNLRW